MRSYCLRLLPFLVALVAGCGGTTMAQMRVSGPFTEEHRAAFDDGADYVDDPTPLPDAWLRSWEDDINRRVSLADVVAVVRVTTVGDDDMDMDRRSTFRLLAHVEARLFGDIPDDLTLVSEPTDPGIRTIDGHARQLLGQAFVAFVKWVDDDGRVAPRWHLSPASTRVIARARALVERHRASPEDRRRVVVHEHDGEGGGDEDDDGP